MTDEVTERAILGSPAGDGTSQNAHVPKPSGHEDYIQKLDAVFYIRWTSGPNYEDAFICVEDGEPDMNAIAKVPFGKASLFAEAYRAAQQVPSENMPTSDLADTLRTELREVATTASVPMELWDRFSNHVLDAARALTELKEALRPFAEAYEEGRHHTSVAMRIAAYREFVGTAHSAIAYKAMHEPVPSRLILDPLWKPISTAPLKGAFLVSDGKERRMCVRPKLDGEDEVDQWVRGLTGAIDQFIPTVWTDLPPLPSQPVTEQIIPSQGEQP